MIKKENNSTFELEKDFHQRGEFLVIGCDEVGRGPLCGPVVAAAAMLKNPQEAFMKEDLEQWLLIRDSKKLSAKQREKAAEFIHEHFYVGIGLCDHETIDRINILEASFLAMKKAVQELLRKIPNDKFKISNEIQNINIKNENTSYIILVDGNKEIPNFSFRQKAIIGGDKFVKSISAASIVAKVMRDGMMAEFGKKYPGYGMEKHMGYGTKLHLEALEKMGPSSIHRKSFAPVKKALNKATLAKL